MPPRSRGAYTIASSLIMPLRAPRLHPQSPFYVCASSSSRSSCSALRHHHHHHHHHRPLSTLSQHDSAAPTATARAFTTSRPLLKKSKAKDSSSSKQFAANAAAADARTSSAPSSGADPFDFGELEAGISRALERLKDALAQTRHAGRVSPEMIEALPVELHGSGSGGGGGGGGTSGAGASSSNSNSKAARRSRLSDVATVVPKGGRLVQVFAGEEGHLKPILSALHSSPYSLTPTTPDTATASLCIHVTIPPATAESRAYAAAEAKKSAERAAAEVRLVRADAQKRFRKMELAKQAGKDELLRAHKGMEDVAKKGQERVKDELDRAVKALER